MWTLSIRFVTYLKKFREGQNFAKHWEILMKEERHENGNRISIL